MFQSATGSIDSTTVSTQTSVAAFPDIPLTALSRESLRKLSHLLNAKKVLRSEEGYERDWRGLALLAKQKLLYDQNFRGRDDPTTSLIHLWCINNPKTATFMFLEQFLGIIDRWDIFDDIYEDLVQDSKIYQAKLHTRSSMNLDKNVDMNSTIPHVDFDHVSNLNILTTSDVLRAQKGLPPQIYDAFVLYADADLNYVSEMLSKLEDNPEYNFKLCMKDRDLLSGVEFEHIALTQLIEERCNHLIVILTEEFLKSPENKFLLNYTQAQQIQRNTRKIVPLLYEDVAIPRNLKIYTHLRYNSSSDSLFNFWFKLAHSILRVNGIADISTHMQPHYKRKNIRMSIVTLEKNEMLKRKEESNQKPLTMGSPKENEMSDHRVGTCIRSTGQLHTANTLSTHSLSTISVNSKSEADRKLSEVVLKKTFSRNKRRLTKT